MTAVANPARGGLKIVEVAAGLVLAGVLAAVAVPQLLDLGKDARSARVESLMSSIQAGAQTVRAASLMNGTMEANGKIQLGKSESATIRTVHGYPMASTDGIVRAANIDALRDKVTIVVDRRATPPTVTIAPLGAAGVCNVLYTQSSSAESPPMIAPSTSGC